MSSMPQVICMEPGCNELVELPLGDEPLAVIDPEYGPYREIELVCRNGHRHAYLVGP
ncbi:MAG: hypothetical protein ACM3ML_15230 [Micromonosporaceae bacterium]